MTDNDWVAPGSTSRPEPPAVAAASDHGISTRSMVRSPGAAPALRPRNLVDVIDQGFAVIRARPAPVLGTTAALVTPMAIVSAWLQRDLLDGAGFLDVIGDPSLGGGPDPQWDATVFALVAGSIVQTLSAVAIGTMVAAWYAEREVDPGTVLVELLRRSPLVLVAWLVSHLLQVVGLLGLGVGALVVATFTVLVAPVMAVERVGPFTAIRRSFSLVRPRFVTCVAFFIGSGVVAGLVGFTLSFLPTGLGFVIGFDVGWLAVAVGEMLGGTVSTAFVAAATVSLYLDLRIRAEGLDLQLAMTDAFTR